MVPRGDGVSGRDGQAAVGIILAGLLVLGL